jgi:hypothetical protein
VICAVSVGATLHIAGAAIKSVVPGNIVLALELGVDSVEIRCSGGVATLMLGSRGRIGQYVPGAALLSSEGSWLAADESRGAGTGVNARPDHTLARLHT